MFKVNNDIHISHLVHISRSSASIVNFEQVNVGWGHFVNFQFELLNLLNYHEYYNT